MPDEARAGLEELLLEARQRPALDGQGQGQSAQEVAEVVGDDPEHQSDLVGPEPMAGSRAQWVTSLPSLIHCSAVPRWLEKWTTARFGPIKVATMTFTRGKSSP